MGIYAKSLFFDDVGIGLNSGFYLGLHGAILFFSASSINVVCWGSPRINLLQVLHLPLELACNNPNKNHYIWAQKLKKK